MAVTILEALKNAEYNLNSNIGFQVSIGKNQLHNAVELLEKGYPVDTEVDPLIEEYGAVEEVPEYDEDDC